MRTHCMGGRDGSLADSSIEDLRDTLLRHMFGSAKPPEPSGKSRDQAASLFGVSARYVQDAKLVKQKSPELFDELFTGRITVSAARNRLGHKLREKEIDDLKLAAAKAPKDCKIIVGDNLAVMQKDVRPATVACLFTDIPYNNGWPYDADPTGDRVNQDEFISYWMQRFAVATRLLTDAGSLFVMIDDENSDLLGSALRKLGLYRKPTIVWWEHFPNNNANGLARAARYIHHFTKTDRPFINTVESRVPSKRQTEYADSRANPLGKLPDNVWQVNRVTGNRTDAIPFKDAPPQLPVDVPERCILLTTKPGDLVLDPCNGNGTTGLAALRNHRRYVGIDRSKKYAEQSERWIASSLAAASKGAS